MLANDPLFVQFRKTALRTADSLIRRPTAAHQFTGASLLEQSRSAVGNILLTAYAWRLTGDDRYFQRARKEMLAVCGFPDWNPGHFLDTAEMSLAVALGYDWLYPKLSREDRALIRRSLVDKGLRAGLAVYEGRGPAWYLQNDNWNQVCNGGLIAAALAVAEDEPELSRTILGHALESLRRAMKSYEPDGGYPEGPNYWHYGTTYSVLAISLLEGALGSDFGLSRAPAFDRTALYRLHCQAPSGAFFNYADSPALTDPTPAAAWLAERYGPDFLRADARRILTEFLRRYRVETLSMHESARFFALYGVWLTTVVKGDSSPPPLDAHFRGDADIAVFRGAWRDPDAVWLGFKAGTNAVPHSHLDLGSFVLEAGGVRWAEDLGPDDYGLPDYWDAGNGGKRWTHFRLNNFGHSALTVGGALQDAKARAPIQRFTSTPERAAVIADLTEAYPGAASRIRRGIALLRREEVLIQDEVAGLKSGTPLRWALTTRAAITLGPRTPRIALLQRSGKALRAEILEPLDAAFTIEPAPRAGGLEYSNQGVSQLLVRCTPSSSDARLVVMLSRPSDHEVPAAPVQPLSKW